MAVCYETFRHVPHEHPGHQALNQSHSKANWHLACAASILQSHLPGRTWIKFLVSRAKAATSKNAFKSSREIVTGWGIIPLAVLIIGRKRTEAHFVLLAVSPHSPKKEVSGFQSSSIDLHLGTPLSGAVVCMVHTSEA